MANQTRRHSDPNAGGLDTLETDESSDQQGGSTAVVQEESKGLGLSAPGLVGGALASATSAAVGSQLGVAGTIFGAAVSSAVLAVAAALYTNGIKKAQTTLKRVPVPARPRGRAGAAALPTAGREDRVGTASTNRRASFGEEDTAEHTAQHTADMPAEVPEDPDAGAEVVVSKPKRPVKRIVAAAVAIFVLGGGIITGFEALTGKSLAGANGTTIGQVAESKGSALVPGSDYSKELKQQAEQNKSSEGNQTGSTDGDAQGGGAPHNTQGGTGEKQDPNTGSGSGQNQSGSSDQSGDSQGSGSAGSDTGGSGSGSDGGSSSSSGSDSSGSGSGSGSSSSSGSSGSSGGGSSSAGSSGSGSSGSSAGSSAGS